MTSLMSPQDDARKGSWGETEEWTKCWAEFDICEKERELVDGIWKDHHNAVCLPIKSSCLKGDSAFYDGS